MERLASWFAVALIALAGCRADHDFSRMMRDIPSRPVAGRIYGASYARVGTKPGNATEILIRIYPSKEADDLRARVLLWTGNVSDARERLAQITSSGNATAAAWSDYSAALYADAAPDDALQLATALAAADHALDLHPSMPEALFNRALALEAMSLRAAAANAYKRYLQIDGSSPWGPEAQSRLEKLEESMRSAERARKTPRRLATSDDELFINDIAIAFPEESRQWVETSGLSAWGQFVLDRDTAGAAAMLKRCRVVGRALEAQLGDSFIADTVRVIDKADNPISLAKAHITWRSEAVADIDVAKRLFEANGSPMALDALLRMTLLSGRTQSTLPDLYRRTPERYRQLRAQLQRLEALSASISERSDAVLKLYEASTAAFTTLGEKKNAAMTRELEATRLDQTGRTAEAWHLRHATLSWAAEAGDDSRAALTLYETAYETITAGHWDVGHALLNAIVETTHPGEWPRDEALAWRVLAARHAGMDTTALAERRVAHDAVRHREDLLLMEAFLARNPADVLTLLGRSFDDVRAFGHRQAMSELVLERARLYRSAGRPSDAHDDLEYAIALLGRDPVHITNRTIRNAFLRTPGPTYSLLTGSFVESGQVPLPWFELERKDLQREIHLEFHAQHLPAGTLLVTYDYNMFDDRLAIYTASGDDNHVTQTRVPVMLSQIEQLVSEWNRAILHDDHRAFEKVSHELERILIQPIATQVAAAHTLVFVRDPAFSDLPYGALMTGNKHYLVEGHTVVVVPSISAYLRASQTSTTTPRALLSVGNPIGHVPSALPAAESEAKEIASMYPSHALLVEGNATKKRVLGALPYCDAAHFAVHANAGLGDMRPPNLILTPTASDEGILTAPEIAALHLNHLRTVMLAGCRTALSSQAGDDSLVNAFLTAGAGSVIGTLWEVDDAPTHTMSTMFHRELRKGLSPAEALRATQLEMIKHDAPPSVWASLQLYGSGQ